MHKTLRLNKYSTEHRFTAGDIRELHHLWLGPIYSWAGKYRSVDISKDKSRFAHARLIPRLMTDLEEGPLLRFTPCHPGADLEVAHAIATIHAELILVHPFREGNGRLARLLALLMALQAGLPALDFTPLTGRNRAAYIAGIHAAMDHNYLPLSKMFVRVIERSRRVASSRS